MTDAVKEQTLYDAVEVLYHYAERHPILKPAVEAIASAALTSLSVTASQTSKDEYQIVEWMRQMLWDGLTEDLEMLRENKLHGSSEVPAEPQTEKPEEVPSETEKENKIHIGSCFYDVNIECPAHPRYPDVSDQERERFKKEVCTKCRDGKCVIADDGICPNGGWSYAAGFCGNCELRPRSPAQEFFAMQAQKVREALKARGWSEEPELSPWQRRSQTDKPTAGEDRRCAFDDSVECVKEVCYECEHFPADPDDVKRHGMDKALRRARDRVPNWCINRELVRCFHAGHPCDECEHWKLGKELEEDLGACVGR